VKTCVVLLLSFASVCFAAKESSSDKTNALQMLREERFADLEKLVAEASKEPSRFYGGYSRLSWLHSYLSDLPRSAPDKDWDIHIRKLQQWKMDFPLSAYPAITLGNTYIHYAWKARGGDYASKVPREASGAFAERLGKARKFLEAAEGLPTKDPELYRALLWVGIGEGWDRPAMEAAFQNGVRIDRDYLPLYYAKAAYLLPRWHGKPGEWETFATQVANARGGAEGDVLYFAIANSQSWSEAENFFKNTGFSYERIKRAFQPALDRSPQKAAETNLCAWYACIADDRATAQTYFASIGDQPELSVWDNTQKFARWKQWAFQRNQAPQLLPESESSSFNYRWVYRVGAFLLVAVLAAVTKRLRES
jgi:hypothetical protein